VLKVDRGVSDADSSGGLRAIGSAYAGRSLRLHPERSHFHCGLLRQTSYWTSRGLSRPGVLLRFFQQLGCRAVDLVERGE
jgi:hypothetical protein